MSRSARRGALLLAVSLAGLPVLAQETAPLGAPAGWASEEATLIDLSENAELRSAPEARAERLALLGVGRYAVLETRGTWVRVRSGGLEGWVDPLAPPGRDERPPAEGPETEAHSSLDPEVATLALLGDPFAMWGELAVHGREPKEATLARWRRAVDDLPGILHERYRITSRPLNGKHLALLDEATYRKARRLLLGSEPTLEEDGITIGAFSLVRLRADGSEAGVVIHEVTHLLLPEHLSPWLDEGVAEDLALGHWNDEGRLDLRELRPQNLRWGRRLPGLIEDLEQRFRAETISLRELVDIDREALMGQHVRGYPLAGLLVRFLAETEPVVLRQWIALAGQGGRVRDEAAGRQRRFASWLIRQRRSLGGGGLRFGET